nr:peroxidasin homolog [Lepeophtheirus salmonis]
MDYKRSGYAPRVELVLGKSISLTSIYEGSDVYFDCIVSAAPHPIKILWFQDNVQLNQNYTEGILLTNRSLVLQNIARRRSGGYTCQAINAVGRGSSQAIILDVKYIPVCKNKQPVVHGVGKSEMVDVICDVTANPSKLKFHWTFNNSADFINVPRVRAIKVNDTRSKLTYTPRTNKDYGTLMCSATNEVGTQKNPCIFHIILAGQGFFFFLLDFNKYRTHILCTYV